MYSSGCSDGNDGDGHVTTPDPEPARRHRVFGPAQFARAPIPQFLWWLLAAALVCGVGARATGGNAGDALQVAALVLALAFGAIAAIWAEQRAYDRAAARGRLARILFALWVPLGVALGAVLCIALLEPLLEAVGIEGLAAVALLVFALWYLGAALGSLLIHLIDIFVSTAFSSFRARNVVGITTLVLSVTAVTGWLALAAAGATVQADQALDAEATAKLEQLHAVARWFVDLATGDQAGRLRLVFMIALFTGLPTLVSAVTKAADSISQRVAPLALAARELAGGARDVRLEVGGSREFRDVATQFNRMVDALELSEQMERAFGVYVSGPVLERIRAQHGAALIAAARREATVFFADLRDFTAISERLDPETLLAVLNRFFERVVAVVGAHEGYLDNFLGDAVLVVFNGPIDQPDHPQRALRCALAVHETLAEMNRSGQFPEVGALRLGIGVATGPLVAGNVGGSTRTRYTVIGDTVNLAARLCAAAPAGELWMNRACRDAVADTVDAVPLPPVPLKGKSEPVEAFGVRN